MEQNRKNINESESFEKETMTKDNKTGLEIFQIFKFNKSTLIYEEFL